MRVLVAVEQELVRYGLIQLLKDIKPLEYIAEVNSVSELIESMKNYQFDLIVIDVGIKGGKGVTALIPRLKELPTTCKRVFMLQEKNDLNEIAYRDVIHGEMQGDWSLARLMDFFQRVLRGERVYLQNLTKTVSNFHKDLELSKREREVFQLKVNGYTVKDTAKLLNIAPKTVENHRRNIRKKLRISKNNEWVEWGKRLGLL